jgi:ABC-type multidrug transport system ATPase subunit
MKQRVKLCGNLLCDTPVSFLDEPLSNLDAAGILLYQDLIEQQRSQKAIFVASNDNKEYEFVENRFEILDKQIIQVQ